MITLVYSKRLSVRIYLLLTVYKQEGMCMKVDFLSTLPGNLGEPMDSVGSLVVTPLQHQLLSKLQRTALLRHNNVLGENYP